MLDQLRKAMEMVSGVTEIPRSRAEKLARSLVGKVSKESSTSGASGTGKSQIASIAEEIVRRSRENAEMIRSLVSSEVRRQIKSLGLATSDDIERLTRRLSGLARRDDMDRLLRRIEKLENKTPSKGPTTKATPKAAATKPKPAGGR